MEIGDLYGEGARALQDEFDARRLADRLLELTVHAELTEDDIELIGGQSTVWISTVDADGWPDVSYKGGDPGFVRVVSPTELRIPSYDGNGMMRTMGNIADTGRVGLLFVDLGRPWRIRIHGTARVATAAADVADFHGAFAVMIVSGRPDLPQLRALHPPRRDLGVRTSRGPRTTDTDVEDVRLPERRAAPARPGPRRRALTPPRIGFRRSPHSPHLISKLSRREAFILVHVDHTVDRYRKGPT